MSETRPLTDTPDGCWAPQWTVALPVTAKLVVKGATSSLTAVAGQPDSRGAGRRAAGPGGPPGRRRGLRRKELRQLAPGFTWTTRLRKDAALHDRPPGKTGRRGRPATGTGCPRSPSSRPARCSSRSPSPATAMPLPCMPHPLPVVFRLRFVARPGGADPRSFRLRLRPGLVTTDTAATAAQVIERVRKQMDHRDRDRSCQAGLRHRAGPQPHRPRPPPHCPLPARLPEHRHHLVRQRRARSADVGGRRPRPSGTPARPGYQPRT
jgi:hypothetical protein